MRQTGVYQIVLPESGDMDGFARFMRLEDATGVHADPLLRLMALLSPRALDRVQDLAKRLKLSGAERERLVSAMKADAALDTMELDEPKSLRAALYQHGERALRDVLILQAARALDADPEKPLPDGVADRVARLWNLSDTWTKPDLPVSGNDLLERGISCRAAVGRRAESDGGCVGRLGFHDDARRPSGGSKVLVRVLGQRGQCVAVPAQIGFVRVDRRPGAHTAFAHHHFQHRRLDRSGRLCGAAFLWRRP
jgi:tRNA nucleotidyltransferase/poly(A) polymerase